MMLRALKHSRFWSAMVALLMAAQLGLAFHSLEHKFEAGLSPSDHCALCQVASAMGPGPASQLLAPPNLHELTASDTVATPPPHVLAAPSGFRSRAPPRHVSV
jgi:hypothetical protein